MPTFQVDPLLIRKGIVTLTGKEAHHLARVLRVGVGDSLTLTDGEGQLFKGTVVGLAGGVTIEIDGALPLMPEPYPVHLFTALVKGEALETIVEKSTELNIDSVHFIRARRSVIREIPEPKWQRFGRVVQAAQKQSGRARPLTLVRPLDFAEAADLHATTGISNIIFEERSSEKSLREIFRSAPPPPYSLWIGPEGGWDPEEKALAHDRHFTPATLGPLVLRAPTAAIHAISSVLALSF